MTESKRVSSDDRVDRLWAVQEIKNLALTYAYAVDTRDWPLLESLWVETDEPSETLLDIHMMRQLPAFLEGLGASTLLVANHLIEFDGPDHATGSVYCYCMMDWGGFIDQNIIYKDIYERHDGKWLFRTRDHRLWWGIQRQENPMKQSPANWPDSPIGSGDAFEFIRRRGVS